MEILRDFKQISDKVLKIFNVDVSNVPILDVMPKSDLEALVKGAKVSDNEIDVNNLAELIFQLNEYLPALGNFVKMFLTTKHYNGIIYFMEKLFVAHVGPFNYVSKNKEYSHTERFFDRFIEVAKSTDLAIIDVLPFIFAIIEDEEKSVLSYWLAPALEYMQNVYRENMDDVKEYIKIDPSRQITYFELGLEFNTQKAIKEIFDLDDGAIDDKLIAKILKHYYTDTMAFFDKNLENAGDKKLHYVKIMASIDNPEVTARLENLYEEETNDAVRAFIKSRLGIADKQNLGFSPKHFEVMARKKVENVQERTLGIPFEKMTLKFSDGTESDNIVKTYLLNIFKTEKDLLNLYGLGDVKTLFDIDDLNNFAQSLFYAIRKMKDIKEAKWAIRFISLTASEEFLETIFEFICELYKQSRAKEAKYFIECLIYSKRDKVILLLSKLLMEQEIKFIENKNYFISLYAETLGRSNSDVMDMLVNDEMSEETLETQKQRLYSNFIANKSYTRQQFNSMFIDKKVFNALAQNLVFGEYKFDRLFALFVLEGQNVKYIAGSMQADDKDLKIKIAHSLDLDERFEDAKKYFSNPTFTQFSSTTFSVRESEKTQTKVGSMHGILINALRFVSNMATFGFNRNVNDERETVTELVSVCPELNLLAEVSFETPISFNISTSSIGNVRFYKLNQCLKNGKVYIINKANAIAVGGVEPRYYDYVLNAVAQSIKM